MSSNRLKVGDLVSLPKYQVLVYKQLAIVKHCLDYCGRNPNKIDTLRSFVDDDIILGNSRVVVITEIVTGCWRRVSGKKGKKTNAGPIFKVMTVAERASDEVKVGYIWLGVPGDLKPVK